MNTIKLRYIPLLVLCFVFFSLSYSQESSVLKLMDNANWDDQFDTQGLNGMVSGLAVYGEDVYAGGTFTNAGGVAANHIARWNGTSWCPLGGGVNDRVREIVVYLDKVYVGGSFTTAGSITANHIAKWNGSSWSALSAGENGDVYAIAVDGNNVYVGGDFQKAAGITVNNIAVFNTDTETWSSLGNGVTFIGSIYGMDAGWEDAIVYDILIRGSDIFIGGKFNKAGADTNANNVAYWNGSSWHTMGNGIQPGFSWRYIYSLATDWSNIYAGTSSDFTGLVGEYNDLYSAEVFKWSGSWISIGEAYYFNSNGYMIGFPAIHALDYSSGKIFAGGEFTQDGCPMPSGDPTQYPDLEGNFIVLWDGSHWASLGSGTNGNVFEIVARPSEVWVGGDFTSAGNKPSYNIGRYVLNSFPDLTCIHVPADYPTIQEAIDVATDDDTIMVASGIYNIDSPIINNRVNNLKIFGSRNEDGSNASIIDASINPGEHFCLSFQNVTGCEISGFEIKNGLVGIFYDNCMNCHSSSNYIHNQHSVGGGNVPSGICICNSSQIDIKFCILDSNQVRGIDIWQSENIDIINNTIVNNDHQCGCWINNSDHVTIKNNIFAYNNTHGIGINNCTFAEFIHDYNCFWQNSTDPIQGYSHGTNSFIADPLFIPFFECGYYLQPGSPCLNTGEGKVDIGALGITPGIVTTYSTGEPVPGADIFIEQEPDDEPISHSRTTTDSNGIVSIKGTLNVAGFYSINILIPDSIAEELGIMAVGSKGGFAIGGFNPAKILARQEVSDGNGVTVDFYSPGEKAIPDTGDIVLEGGSIEVDASVNFPYSWNYMGFLSYFKPNTVQAQYTSASSGTAVMDTASWSDTLNVSLVRGDSVRVTTFMNVSEEAELAHELTHIIQQKEGTGSTLQFAPPDSGIYTVSYMVTGTQAIYQPFKVYLNITLSDTSDTFIKEEDLSVPEDFTLLQNYPNPFNLKTAIRFTLPVDTKVTLSIYDSRGALVETLADSKMSAGIHTITWDADEHPSGIYFYSIEIEKIKIVKKCILLK